MTGVKPHPKSHDELGRKLAAVLEDVPKSREEAANRAILEPEEDVTSYPSAEAIAEGLQAALSNLSPAAEQAVASHPSADPMRQTQNTEELKPTPAVQTHPLAAEMSTATKISSTENVGLSNEESSSKILLDRQCLRSCNNMH